MTTTFPALPDTPVARPRAHGHRGGVLALAVLVLLVLFAVVAPFFLADPNAVNLDARLLPPAWLAGGDGAHLLGTDSLGRDLLARIARGTGATLEVGLLSTVFTMLLGVAAGVGAGWFGGWFEQTILRIMDVQYTIPGLVLLVLLVGLVRPGLVGTSIILAIASWTWVARVLHPEVAVLRRSEFVTSLTATGVAPGRIVLRHVLPNIAGLAISVATLTFAVNVLAEAALGFLGLGSPPPEATIGGLISTGQVWLVAGKWWITVFAGAALVLLLASANRLGDWLSDLVAKDRQR